MTENFTIRDQEFMKHALALALKAQGRTSPNPVVGCVIVKDDTIVGAGFHAKPGGPHAEIEALKQAGAHAEGSDVYVTLEPCSHYGKTPPCADALIQAGVKRVVAAMQDPNPLVSGQGFAKLEQAGIAVAHGLLSAEAQSINKPFLKAIIHKLPYVLYKSALTLDGKTSVENGDSKWITSERSREYAHQLRNIYDVIMVGSNTILHDNPLLNCRLDGGRDPVRLVIDGSLSIPVEAQVLNSANSPCLIATTRAADPAKLTVLRQLEHVEVWQYDEPRIVSLERVLRDLTSRGWNSVLLEGGGILAGHMLGQRLIDQIEFIYAPKLAGAGSSPLSGMKLAKMADAVELDDMIFTRLDKDFIISGRVRYDNS